MEPSINDIV